MSEQRVAWLKERLQTLKPTQMKIIDDSHLHEGHASAGGAGYFTVIITAEVFNGLSSVKRHQQVYKAVGDLIPNEVHALSIKASGTE